MGVQVYAVAKHSIIYRQNSGSLGRACVLVDH